MHLPAQHDSTKSVTADYINTQPEASSLALSGIELNQHLQVIEGMCYIKNGIGSDIHP